MTDYFNYFTGIEEHFQRARGTSLFLLSPIDWALIETWKNSDVPLEAVLRGIDAAFEKWRSRKIKVQAVNSLAYCAQAVLMEAQRLADGSPPTAAKLTDKAASPFPEPEICAFLQRNAAQIRETGVSDFETVAACVDELIAQLPHLFSDLEQLDQRLTSLHGKLVAIARTRQTDEDAFTARRELDAHLRPYRSRMTAPQLAMLEIQFLERDTLGRAKLPHLSLFYLR